jgi:hypothetical protein
MPDSLVVSVMTAHKAALLAGEQEQMRAMAQRWRQVENSLTDQVELFVRRVQEDGLTASALRSRQFQLDRYQSLLSQVRTQLDAYTDYAAPLITAQQRNHAQLGIRHASQAITAVGVDNGVTISFETLPTSAVENMAGLAGDGSPLRDLLRDSYGSAADGMLNELTRATALGQNPVVTASRMIRNGLSQSLTRMLATARTEQLRVYRQSSLMTYRHSNVVSGYKRLATKDLRVCMACLMDDGHRYEVSEVMPEHVQGRCAMIPIVDGYKAATWQQGPDWFKAQSDANQQKILGEERYDAWKDGKFDLDKLVTLRKDAVWGASIQPTTMKDLLAGKGGMPKVAAPKVDAAGFPLDLKQLENVRGLGGSTGAMLVKDPETGTLFVMKRGNSAGHLLEETYADAAYKALGVNVPEFKVIYDNGAPVKLAKFIEGESLANLRYTDAKAYQKAIKELRKDFAADSVLGNWDVIGAGADNVLVTKDGKVYRIDNGGSLRYRAQGALKTEFGKYVDEFWTLRNAKVNSQTATVYGDLPYADIIKQSKTLEKQRAALLDAMPAELRATMAARLDVVKDLTKIHGTLKKDAFVEKYIENFSEHSIGLRKAGLVDALPKKLTVSGVTVFDENYKAWDNLRGSNKDTMIGKLANYMAKNGGDYNVITYWSERQASDSWTGGAQATKYFYAKQRDKADAFWWKDGKDAARAHYEGATAKLGDTYDKTLTQWHAWNYEFMRNTKFANNNLSKGVVKLIRTENAEVLAMNNLAKGTTGTIKRGAIESTSVFQRVTVFGTETTTQLVPHHRIMGNYMFEREVGSNRTLFMGDHENEIVAMMDDLEVTYENN